MSRPAYDAVVLAGGGATRLGGRDKPAELVGGTSLLDRVLAAVPDAEQRIVVGPVRRVTATGTTWAREDPPGGGPVAALAAGLAVVSAPTVVMLAADLPFVSADTVGALLDALRAHGALLLDAAGRDQPMVSAWRVGPLRAALAALPTTEGASLRRVVAALDVCRLSVSPLPGRPPPWLDCDTQAELALARELA